jgi:molybdenum cofactor cytidylyltransferase
VSDIAAIVLAAGESRRMGQPKLLLRWGQTTVLGQVIETLRQAEIEEVLVVTGASREAVEQVAARHAARTAFNEAFASRGMLSSIQCGLRAQLPGRRAALICLGDQPQMREETVRGVCAAYRETEAGLVIPSYRNRRGHPWLAARSLWEELLALPASATPRAFIHAHSGEVRYVPADESILQDLDTPEEYERQRP